MTTLLLALSLPDVPEWLHTLLRIKNFLLIAVVVLAVLAAARRDGKRS
jgi:hypothetical protein